MNQTVVIEDPGHAPFAPSGLKRIAVCPASHQAEKPYTDVSDEDAIDGTHTHTLVEQCLIQKKKPRFFIGKTLVDHEGEFVVEKDRAERANIAITYVMNQVKASKFPVFVTPEQRVNPGSLIFRDDWYGTADITMIFADTLDNQCALTGADIEWINVCDYKDGELPIDPYQNLQGISYMLGIIEKYMPPMDTPITFTIIQPKAGGISEWMTTVGELMDIWLPKCAEIISLCEQPDAPFSPDEEYCRECLHKLDCKARQGAAIDGINTALVSVAHPNEVTGSGTAAQPTGIISPIATALPVIGEMDMSTLDKVAMLAPIVRGWMKNIDAELHTRVEKGGVSEHFKMIQKNGRRKWVENQGPVVKALTSMTHGGERTYRKGDVVEDKLISFTKILANPNLTVAQKTRIEKDFIKHPAGQKALVLKTEGGKDISPAALLAELPVIEMQTGK
jgi:hypothetical protein